MKKKTDYTIFIGRSQPAHKAHIETIRKGLELSERLIVMIGSANQARTFENPWTWKERAEMIRSCFSFAEQERLRFCAVPDVVGNTNWVTQIQSLVDGVVRNDIKITYCVDVPETFLDVEFAPTINTIGHKKDHSSFYLNMFPQWKHVEIDLIDDLHATDIRAQMFEDGHIATDGSVPAPIVDYLNAFMNSDTFDHLKEEFDFIQKYRKAWNWEQTLNDFIINDMPKLSECGHETLLSILRDNHKVAPYDNNFVTADAVVVQSGHVLLIRRRHAPGKGLWALPGGHVKKTQTIEEAVLAELLEETRIKVPVPVLKSKIENCKHTKVFDDPKRSLRGRTFTHAYYIELPSVDGPLPKVRGGDDADKAKWVPLNVFDKMEDQLFEDHYRIVQHFTKSSDE